MDLILLVVFSYLLHRRAALKGISPWPYILNFISIFILATFAISFIITGFVGVDVLKSGNNLEILLGVEAVVIALQIALFFFMRRRIDRVRVYEEHDDVPPPPPGNKKDLSYFR